MTYCIEGFLWETPFKREANLRDEEEEVIRGLTQKFGFIKRVNEGWITTVKDLETGRLKL